LPQFGPGVRVGSFGYPLMAQTGEIGYDLTLDGPGSNGTNWWTVWAGPRGNVDLVARTGERPPDVTDGRVYAWPIVPSMAREGHVAFNSGLLHPGHELPEQYGLWTGRPEAPRLVARTGMQAPGTEPGVHFSSTILTQTFTVNRRGAVAFPAAIDGPGVTPWTAAGIWAGTREDLSLVVRSGDPAPVPEPDSRFVGLPFYAIINGNDRVLFPGYVTGPGIHSGNHYGLWVGRAGAGVELIAREGDEVPGLGPEYRISRVYPYMQTEDDRIAAVLTFTGPDVTADNDQIILFGRPGQWETVFREGGQAPGLPQGVALNFNERVPKMAILASGASGMILNLAGDGVTPENDRALVYRRSQNGPWFLVAREGELFDGSVVGDDGLFIRVNGGGAGAIPSINDRGDLAFGIQFEGDFPNSVFGAYLVPEPATGLFFAASIGPLVSTGRKPSVRPAKRFVFPVPKGFKDECVEHGSPAGDSAIHPSGHHAHRVTRRRFRDSGSTESAVTVC